MDRTDRRDLGNAKLQPFHANFPLGRVPVEVEMKGDFVCSLEFKLEGREWPSHIRRPRPRRTRVPQQRKMDKNLVPFCGPHM